VAGEATGTKKQRDQLRAALHDHGCTPEQIATEMTRQFGFRARPAWRHTYGWTQDEVAATYNRHLDHDQAPMTGKRISDYETWPHGGVKPTINALAMLARIYSTGALNLIDLDDRKALSTQELITLDTHKTPQMTAPGAPDTPSENNTKYPAGERTTQSDPTIAITVQQTNHTPEATVPPKHRRGHLVSILLLTITMAISGVLIAHKTMTGSHPPMPAHPSSPESGSSAASMPTSSSSPPSPVPPPSPLLAPTQAAPLPHQSFTPLSTPIRAVNIAPPQQILTQQHTPPSTRSDPPPSSPELPTADTASASTTSVSWKNVYYDRCLDEQEGDITHDPANIQLWDCISTSNQMWTEKTIIANPTSIAKNLVSSRTGRCITYQPGDYSDRARIWLTSCGKDGQGWIRTRNGTTYTFEAAEVHGMCMAATNGTVTDTAGTYTGILLRRCDSSSPLKDWRFY
jgi:Ricin-type beta-trefoil lectin domain